MTTKSKADVSAYTAQQRVDELWRRGVLVPWLCHAVQQQMNASFHASKSKKYVVNSARRLGKSYWLCTLAQEYARQHPNAQIKYAADTQRAVKKIILPLMRQIMETCPKHLRPRFSAHDLVYEFSNGSEIHIAGAAMDQADSLRGTSCDLALIDEAGFISDLEYLVDSVLLPQTLTRPHARIVMASTPPVSPDHPFVSKYMAQAMGDGAYSRYTIFDNPLLSAETIEEFKKEAGGEDSTTWRREYLAEIVTETENALFPEANAGDLMEQLVYAVERPRFFYPIVSVDLGYTDFTGILFGYYHFGLAKIVIEDEILVNKTTSADIVAMIQAKERELWGNVTPRTRIVDGPALAIADMNQTHRFQCRVPEKSDLPANVNRVRIDLAERRLVFHPRCKNTVAQVKFGTWDNQRKGFSRSASGGHWDLVASLIYLCKHVDRSSNPVPHGFGFDPFNDFGYPKRQNTSFDAIRSMFPHLRK
jgi:hypothetical protein